MTLNTIQDHIRKYTQVLRKKWWFLVLIALLVGGAMYGYSHTKEVLYTSFTSFLPEKGESKSVSFDPVSALLGGGGAASGTNEISGVLASRFLSEQIASDSISFRDQQMLVADAMLTHYLIERFSWKKLIDETLDVMAIPFEQKVISAGKMVRSGLTVYKDDFGFIQMRFTFGEPEVVEQVSKLTIEVLKTYLITKRTEKDSLNYQFFETKSDSVRAIIEENAKYIARFADRSRFATRAIDRLEAEKREVENQSLIQVLKQYELSRENAISQIQKNTPMIHVLDEPKPPFMVIESSKITHLIVGIFLGIMIASVWVTRRIWRKDVRELIEKALA